MNNKDYLAHYGIKGQKWGLRRYQNPDGTYTAAGKARRNKGTGKTSYGKGGGGGGGNSGWMYDNKYEDEGSARSAVKADITSRNAKQILDSEKGIASSLRDATDAVDNLNRSRQISKYRQTGIDPSIRDDEIQRAINRMDVENRFYDQKYRYDTQGKAKASDALKLIGGLTAAAAGTALVASMIRKNNLDAARIKKAIYSGKKDKLTKEEKKALKEQKRAEKKAEKEYRSDTNAYEWWLTQAAYARNNAQYNSAMSNAMLMLSHRDKKPMTYTDLDGKKHTVIYDASMLETMYNGSKQNPKYGKKLSEEDQAKINSLKYDDAVKLAQAKQKAKTTVKKAKLKAKTDQAVAKAKNLSTDYNKDGTLTDKGRDKLIRQLVKNEQVIRSATRSVRNADKFGNVTGSVVPLASMGLLGAVSPAVMAAFPATAGIGGAVLAGTAIKKLSSTGVKALGQKEIESANVRAASIRNRLDEDDRKRRAMAHSEDFLAHYGIKGQKWGVRRFQNSDGSYTHEGKVRYGRIKTSGKKPKYGSQYDDYDDYDDYGGGSSYDKYVSRANRGSSNKDYSYKMNLTPNSKLRTAGTVLAGLALASMGTKYLVKNLDDLYAINKLDRHAVENSMKIMDLKNANKMKKIEANYKKGNLAERAYRKVKSVKLNKALKKEGKVNSDNVLLNRRGVRKYIKKHGGLTTTEQKVNTALSQVGSRYPDTFDEFRKGLQKPTYTIPKTNFKMTNGTGGIPSRKVQKAMNRAAQKEAAKAKALAKRAQKTQKAVTRATKRSQRVASSYTDAQKKLNRANDEFDKIFDDMNKVARKKGKEFRKWGKS